MQAKAGVKFLILHGCVKCNRFVYEPQDKRKPCPYVKANGEVCGALRYDAYGEAQEVNDIYILNKILFNLFIHNQNIFCRKSFIFLLSPSSPHFWEPTSITRCVIMNFFNRARRRWWQMFTTVALGSNSWGRVFIPIIVSDCWGVGMAYRRSTTVNTRWSRGCSKICLFLLVQGLS